MNTEKTKVIDGRKRNGGKGKVGRKKETDVAIPVTAYIKKSQVKILGGIDNARILSKEYLQSLKLIPNTAKDSKHN